MSDAAPTLDLVANARMPSQRAQSLQVAQMASAFQRVGAQTRLIHARRVPTPPLPDGKTLFEHYAVPEGPEPDVLAVECRDWIDRSPRRMQFVPARLQEWSFARSAARAVLDRPRPSWVLSRELETARYLVRAGHRGIFLELHRVPGGRLRRRWLAEACDGARGVVAISGGVAQDLERIGIRAEVLVEHDGFPAERFDGSRTQAAARAAIGVPADVPLVVYTGGLLEWKGVDVLIDAARRLPEYRFVIAGGMDADVDRMREYAEGVTNVRLDGFQSPERVLDYLVAGDLGVVPNRSRPEISARYTSPLKVFEAMGVGLPLVVSDLPSLRDILDPTSEAVFVTPDSPLELAAGIQRAMEDSHLRYHLSKRARKRAPRHSWTSRARRILRWMGERAV
ncbi:MAG: glycosyltransferase family 4 protein [Planctomycetota bacterium]